MQSRRASAAGSSRLPRAHRRAGHRRIDSARPASGSKARASPIGLPTTCTAWGRGSSATSPRMPRSRCTCSRPTTIVPCCSRRAGIDDFIGHLARDPEGVIRAAAARHTDLGAGRPARRTSAAARSGSCRSTTPRSCCPVLQRLRHRAARSRPPGRMAPVPGDRLSLSIVIPAFNEARRIRATLDQLTAFLERQPWDWEIRVVDDGSTDETVAIVEAARAQRTRGSCCSASRIAARAAPSRPACSPRARTIRFMCDADLSMPPAELPRFLPPAQTRLRHRDRQPRRPRREARGRTLAPARRRPPLQLCDSLAGRARHRRHAVRIQDVHGRQRADRFSRTSRSTDGRSTSKC